jgi:hypothetical protein
MLQGVYWLIGGIACLIFAGLDIFAPSLMIRWQMKSTAKHDDFRRTVGTTFQQWMNVHPSGEPWKDPSVRLRARLIGGFLALFGLAFVLVGVVLIQRA